MFDLGSLSDLAGGAGDVIQDTLASAEEVLPVDSIAAAANGVTDIATRMTDQISEAGSGIADSISSLLP